MKKPISLSQIGLYNPQRQSPEVTEMLFVARQKQFELLLNKIVQEKENSIPQHYLIIGQRGMGKTTMLKRIEVELHKPDYRKQFIPLLFPEEQYNVKDLAEFWMNCLDALADSLELEDKGKYRTEISSKSGNLLISDEPQEVGGKNLGFSPFELLASALASCTLITLRMYIDRKAWDVSELTIWVDFEKNDDHMVSLFSTKILITGNVDDAQKQRILKIANSCPVHKTLINTINIETSLV